MAAVSAARLLNVPWFPETQPGLTVTSHRKVHILTVVHRPENKRTALLHPKTAHDTVTVTRGEFQKSPLWRSVTEMPIEMYRNMRRNAHFLVSES